MRLDSMCTGCVCRVSGEIRCSVCVGEPGGVRSKNTSEGVWWRKMGVEGAVCERDSSLLGWDQFYLINCYRNIYPGCSLSSSHDVFMCSGCVHRHGQGCREREKGRGGPG